MKENDLKKKLPRWMIIVIIVVFFLLLLGIGLGIGSGSGNGEGDGKDTQIERKVDSEISVEFEEIEKTYLKVTVSEGDYFFENEKMQLDELIGKINETEGKAVVEITDDQATKNAYDALIEALKNNNIEYVEK
ncbi:MAG: hypothetical protein J5802_06760 [Butyrivibrio sp.]|nr:hypothetical protein [Butyrivibrio sp.]